MERIDELQELIIKQNDQILALCEVQEKQKEAILALMDITETQVAHIVALERRVSSRTPWFQW